MMEVMIYDDNEKGLIINDLQITQTYLKRSSKAPSAVVTGSWQVLSMHT